MSTLKNASLTKLRVTIGRVKGYLKDGLTVTEISEKLNLPEAEVLECKEIIDKADENRKKMLKTES